MELPLRSIDATALQIITKNLHTTTLQIITKNLQTELSVRVAACREETLIWKYVSDYLALCSYMPTLTEQIGSADSQKMKQLKEWILSCYQYCMKLQ